MSVDWATLGATIGIPVARSVGGWLTKATADGKISNFEFQELGKTVLRTGIIGSMIFFGADGMGLDITAVGSAASAVIFDMILSAWKENKNVKPKVK